MHYSYSSMKQLHGGYILKPIDSVLSEKWPIEKVRGILRLLSHFDVESNADLNNIPKNPDPILAVINNLISRGLPTLPSLYIEDIFCQRFKKAERVDDAVRGIDYNPINITDDFARLCYRALHIIDPRISVVSGIELPTKSWKNLDSNYEEQFLTKHVPEKIGEYAAQLLESQRNLENILRFADDPQDRLRNYLYGAIDKFFEQRVDFAFELPYTIEPPEHLKKIESFSGTDKIKGMIIEIDGPEHQEDKKQARLDALRDEAVLKARRAPTLRIPTKRFDKINELIHPLSLFFQNEYCQLTKLNFEEPLYNTTEGKQALVITLAPFAIARVQKIIIEFMLRGLLNLEAPKWRIAIVERDVPCGRIALRDLQLYFSNIFSLAGINREMPEIECDIFATKEFADLRIDKNETINDISEIDLSTTEYDMVIDISVLRRRNAADKASWIKCRYWAIIRSAFSINARREFLSAALIKYPPLLKEIAEGKYECVNEPSIRFFLNNIFRKVNFRDGQLRIVDRALRLENAIGLLPTGGGKSLTYQMAALLQPGICLIVDPLRSLMHDQHRSLLNLKIDCSTFINSSLTWYERSLAENEMIRGEVIFVFVSPERLLINKFRNLLRSMGDGKHFFSYCIIDEVHCVSEWGHDFRPAYLMLGRNARDYCRTFSGGKITLIGLTATASFDVLADVQRSLEVVNEDAIIRSENIGRKELVYRVKKEFFPPIQESYMARREVGMIKHNDLYKMLKKVPDELAVANRRANKEIRLKSFDPPDFYKARKNGLYDYGLLIFCPHTTSYFGVHSQKEPGVVNTVQTFFLDQKIDAKVGTFVGSSNEDLGDEVRKIREEESLESQDKFIGNRIGAMVATKAFGMGIDKPNIRVTIHLTYPSSIESFYQEAGRAGRDGKIALCYILFCDHDEEQKILESFHRKSFKGEKREKSILWELLNEIRNNENNELYNEEIYGRIIEDFGIDITMRYWNKGDKKRIYVNYAGIRAPGIGYIDVENGGKLAIEDKTNLRRSEKILQTVKDMLIKILGSLDNIIIPPKIVPGIEKVLDEMQEGEARQIIIGFRNDGIRLLTELLKKKCQALTENMVEKSLSWSENFDDFIRKLEDDFIRKLEKKCGRKCKWTNDEFSAKNSVEKIYWGARDELDTHKAIYRLAVIGVIDQYDIDYNRKTFTVYIRKKPEQEYVNSLYEYVCRFMSRRRADQFRDGISMRQGKTIIQKCLNGLIEIIYSQIEAKRFKAIELMRQACREGVGDEGKFREILDLYFNSKYYDELVEMTDRGREEDIDIVWHFIEEAGHIKDNFKHLRGAVSRLISEHPENTALLFLNAFCLFLLSIDDSKIKQQLIDKAKSDLVQGLENYLNSRQIDDRVNKILDRFHQEILDREPRLAFIIEPFQVALWLKLVNNRLKKWNDAYNQQVKK